MPKLQDLEITGAPEAPRTRSNQPYVLDCDLGLKEHAQGDEVKNSALMKMSYFILMTTRKYYASAEGLVR